MNKNTVDVPQSLFRHNTGLYSHGGIPDIARLGLSKRLTTKASAMGRKAGAESVSTNLSVQHHSRHRSGKGGAARGAPRKVVRPPSDPVDKLLTVSSTGPPGGPNKGPTDQHQTCTVQDREQASFRRRTGQQTDSPGRRPKAPDGPPGSVRERTWGPSLVCESAFLCTPVSARCGSHRPWSGHREGSFSDLARSERTSTSVLEARRSSVALYL